MGAVSVAQLADGGSVLAKWTITPITWEDQNLTNRIAAAGIVPQTGDLILATRNEFQVNALACMKGRSSWDTLTVAGGRSDQEPTLAVQTGLAYDVYYLRFA